MDNTSGVPGRDLGVAIYGIRKRRPRGSLRWVPYPLRGYPPLAKLKSMEPSLVAEFASEGTQLVALTARLHNASVTDLKAPASPHLMRQQKLIGV